MDLNAPELQFALDAVRQAARLVRQVQSELVSPALTKDDRSPVTVADFASQALIGERLSRAFPDALLVAEEDSTALRRPEQAEALDLVCGFSSRFADAASPEAVCRWIDFGRVDTAPRFWTLDPIDGTKGFLRGEQYAVALALVQDGLVQLSVLGCPNLVDGYQSEVGGAGSLIYAVRGQGTWTVPLDDWRPEGDAPTEARRLHVSESTDPAQARLMRSVESGHTNVGQIDWLADALGVKAEPVRMDSQAKYAVLAAGGAELLLRLLSPSKPQYKEKIWDQAAGALVLKEAGGRITDLDGRPLDFTTGRQLERNRGILASNGHLHKAALEALKRIQA